MSRHWKPDEDRALWVQAGDYAPPAGKPWPTGATAGLLMVVRDLAIGAVLYQVAAPRDVMAEENEVINWDG